MATDSQRVTTDSVLTFVFLKKLMTPIVKHPAYKLKLVDKTGRIIKKPETKDEKEALTLLDKVMFKVRRLLGAKITALNAFLYLQTMSNNNQFYNKLIVKSSVEQKSEIKRIQKDIDKVAENNGCSTQELMYTYIGNYLKECDNAK